MRRLYQAIIALVLWLSLLFSLEQFAPSFHLVTFLYVFLPIAAVLTIWIVERYQTALQWIFAVALLMYAGLKYQFDYIAPEMDLRHIFSEMSSVGVTLLLSSAIGLRLADIRTTLSKLVIGQGDEEIASFEQGQSMLYREVRRARRRQHSLALLAVSPPEIPIDNSMPLSSGMPLPKHVAIDMQRVFSKKYILTRVGRLLLNKLDDAAIVTQSGDHFVVLIPETSRDELQTLLQMLQTVSQEQLGLKLNVGSATFPDEEITFESLLERAEAAMVAIPAASSLQAQGASPSSGSLELAATDSSTSISSIS
jgi:hypothetical protein